MKTWLLAAAMATVTAMFVPLEAEAKRLGGGKSTGMQREMPARQSADTPATPATPTQATAAAGAAAPAAAAAAAKPRPAWLAPVAGLAAGLGLAALASSLGFGEELANILTIALLAMAAVFVVRLLMRRGSSQGGARLAAAGAAAGGGSAQPAPSAWTPSAPAQPMAREMTSAAASFGAASAPAAEAELPADFDAAGFERIAKMIFIRMQAAHDAGDLNDLRQFTTPEMFASIRVDLQDRGAAPNHTDVEQVDAQVLDVAQEGERQIVSVRFHGLIREQQGADAEAFDEVWHLVKPGDGNWAIAGIQQRH